MKRIVVTGATSMIGVSFIEAAVMDGNTDAGKFSPDRQCCPVRADGIAHFAAGRLAEILCKKLGMSCIWMRVFSVYGRSDCPDSMISTTVAMLRRDEHCSFTPSEQKWDYLDAKDIGRAFYLVGGKG